MRANCTITTVATILAVLATTVPSHADDPSAQPAPAGEAVKQDAQNAGEAIVKGAKDTGTTIQQHAEPVGQAIKTTAQDTGAKIQTGAQDTGNFLDQKTQDFRAGAADFFHKVGNFFSGK